MYSFCCFSSTCSTRIRPLDGCPVIVVKVKEGKNKLYLLLDKSAYKRVEKADRVFKRLDFDNVLSKKHDIHNTKNFGIEV